MRIATEEDYLEELDKSPRDRKLMCQCFTADDIPGLPKRTYVMWHPNESYSWEELRDFVEEYWRKEKKTEENIRQLYERCKHATDYRMGPEQLSKSQASTEYAKKDILEERRGTHGEFKDVASISQTLKIYFRAQSTWDALTFVQQEALDNIAQKVARIFAGNHNFADHWVDIRGYAKLAQQEIEKNGDRPSSLK